MLAEHLLCADDCATGNIVGQTDPAPALRNPVVEKKGKKISYVIRPSTSFYRSICKEHAMRVFPGDQLERAISLPLAFISIPSSTSSC